MSQFSLLSPISTKGKLTLANKIANNPPTSNMNISTLNKLHQEIIQNGSPFNWQSEWSIGLWPLFIHKINIFLFVYILLYKSKDLLTEMLHPTSITIYKNKSLLNHLRNRDPLSGLPLFLPSHAEAQKKRPIQKRTAKKICTVSLNLDKVIGRPVSQITEVRESSFKNHSTKSLLHIIERLLHIIEHSELI